MKTMVSTASSGLPGAIASSDVLPPGAKAGPWVVERELGRGGMGAVYAVVHEEIGKRAALKVVHQRLLAGFNCDRMLLEAKVVNQVGHPNIVDIF
jgi:serine/threonine protein kinase